MSSSRALVVVASLFLLCLASLFADTAVLCFLCAGRARHWQIGEGGAREEQEGEHKQPSRWEEGDRRGQGEQRHREAAHPARQEQQVLRWDTTTKNGVCIKRYGASGCLCDEWRHGCRGVLCVRVHREAMDRGLGCREVGARKDGELRGSCVRGRHGPGTCHVDGLVCFKKRCVALFVRR